MEKKTEQGKGEEEIWGGRGGSIQRVTSQGVGPEGIKG